MTQPITQEITTLSEVARALWMAMEKPWHKVPAVKVHNWWQERKSGGLSNSALPCARVCARLHDPPSVSLCTEEHWKIP